MDRQQAHQRLDRLGDAQFEAVAHLLEVLTPSLSEMLAAAPVEDEEVTPEMARALDEARESLRRGEGVAHDDILREFGLHRSAGLLGWASSGRPKRAAI